MNSVYLLNKSVEDIGFVIKPDVTCCTSFGMCCLLMYVRHTVLKMYKCVTCISHSSEYDDMCGGMCPPPPYHNCESCVYSSQICQVCYNCNTVDCECKYGGCESNGRGLGCDGANTSDPLALIILLGIILAVLALIFILPLVFGCFYYFTALITSTKINNLSKYTEIAFNRVVDLHEYMV